MLQYGLIKKHLAVYLYLEDEYEYDMYEILLQIINQHQHMSYEPKQSDMKKAYRFFTKESWSKSKALPKVWEAAWKMSADALKCRSRYGYYEEQYPLKEEDDYDIHIGCFSYPNCDIDPNGCCVVNGFDAEPYGHRD